MSRRLPYLVIYLAFVLPIIILGPHNYFTATSNLTQQVYSSASALTAVSAVTFAERLNRLVDLGVSHTTQVPFINLVASGRWQAAVDTLRFIPPASDFIERLFITDSAGTLTADFPVSPEVRGQNFAFRDWYTGVTRSRSPYVSQIYRRTATPPYNVVAVAIPILPISAAPDPPPLGYLVLQVKLDTLANWTAEVSQRTQATTYFVDSAGQIAGHPDHPPQADIANFTDFPPVKNLLAGQSGVNLYPDAANQSVVVAYQPVTGTNWGVVASTPTSVALAPVASAQARILAVYSIFFILNSVLAAVTIRILAAQKRAETTQAAAAAEAHFKTLIENVSDAIAVISPAGRIAYASPSIKSVLGYTPAEYLTKDPLELIHPDDRPSAQADLQDLFTSPANFTVSKASRVRRADGSYRWIEGRATNLLSDPAVHGIVVVFHDITEVKAAQEELQKRAAELEKINSLMIGRELRIAELKTQLKTNQS